MSLFERFRQHYLHYLISIIIPALITAFSIPLFKRILGSADYGQFAILFNGMLLGTATITGWITQSVIRFFPASQNRLLFFRHTMRLTLRALLWTALPSGLFVYSMYADGILSLLVTTALCITSFQFTLVSLAQSVFISRKSIFSELIRSVTYLLVALLCLQFTGIQYLYSLFFSITVAYGLSASYLYRQVKAQLQTSEHRADTKDTYRQLSRQFMQYGMPLSFWFICAYLLTLTDKLFIRHWLSSEIQGNYQAMFDLIARTITLVISPVILAMYPLLTNAYEKGEQSAIRKLLRSILMLEAAFMLLTMAGYWLIGAGWLFALIHTPPLPEYKMAGLLIIAGTFIWQMAIVVQKGHELRFRSLRLLFLLVIALCIQLLIYGLSGRNGNLLVYPAGYLIASFAYLLMLLLPGRR